MDASHLSAVPAPVSGGFLQYTLISFAVLIPVLWKLYTSIPAFRYQVKMVWYIICIFLVSALIIPFALMDPFNPDNSRTVGGWIMMKVLRIKDMFGYKLVKRGEENFEVKGGGPFIVVSNHQSSLDLIAMFELMPKRCTGLSKKELLFAGPFGIAAWLCGGIFVDRRPGKSRSTMDDTVLEIKDKNKRIWIFPEGTRNHGGGLLPFKKGAFHIALQAGIPIVPVVISSYSSFYDKASSKFEPGTIIVTVLPPVYPDAYTKETINEFVENTRNQMLEVFESTSKEIDPEFRMTAYRYEEKNND